MSGFRTFEGIARQIATATSQDALDACMRTIRDAFALKNVIYQGWFGATVPTPNLILSTVPQQWTIEYESRRVGERDPIAKATRHSVLPMDWGDLDWGNPDARRYRLMLQRYDVGLAGLTVPIHGPLDNFAVFSITASPAGPADWTALRRQHDAELVMLAFQLHDRALAVTKKAALPPDVRLTVKVTACLELLARGRKPVEIAVELGLSIHTVRKHLDRAVNDLSCQTKAQAITRALALGLIKLRSTSASIVCLVCTIRPLTDDFSQAVELFGRC